MPAAWFIATLVLLYAPADEKIGRERTGSFELSGKAAEWVDLGSPFYAVRREAEQRLIHLGPADALAVVRVLLDAPAPEFRQAAVRWLHRRFEAGLGTEQDRDLLIETLLTERDPSVLTSLIYAASWDEKLVVRLREEVAAGRIQVDFLGEVFEARLAVLFEQVMHEGRVPGFFDGQFSALLGVDDSAYWRILRMAWDARLHFVIRALAVMALHEGGQQDLERELTPLMISATSEVRLLSQQLVPVDEFSVRSSLRARLSQYARFSMAKAGIAGPIEDKIEHLKKLASSNLAKADKLLRLGIEDQYEFVLDRAMLYYFELGYHYQQLDDYLQAELQYRVITEQDVQVSSKRWTHYNLACIRAIQGRHEAALQELRDAVRAGFKDSSWALRDGDLAPLRDDPRFHRILTELDADF